MAQHYAPRIVTDGLALCLDAGNGDSYGGSGATWRDMSGNNNNCSLINTPTFSSANIGSINLNGSNQYGTIPASPTMSPASALTQELWIKLNSTALQVFFGLQYGTSTNNAYCLWYQNGTLNAAINISGTFYQLSTVSLTAGTWYHMVHSWNGSTRTVYLNNVAVGSESRSGTIFYDAGNTLVTLGIDFEGTGYNAGASWYTNGSMSQVRLYNRGLTRAEVENNFNASRGRYGI